mgnify:CR=1 FL=1
MAIYLFPTNFCRFCCYCSNKHLRDDDNVCWTKQTNGKKKVNPKNKKHIHKSSVLSKIRQFDLNANSLNEATKLHVAKVQIMPSITLTNSEMKSVNISSSSVTTSTVNGNDPFSSAVNWKDYYGDDEKGIHLHSIVS